MYVKYRLLQWSSSSTISIARQIFSAGLRDCMENLCLSRMTEKGNLSEVSVRANSTFRLCTVWVYWILRTRRFFCILSSGDKLPCCGNHKRARNNAVVKGAARRRLTNIGEQFRGQSNTKLYEKEAIVGLCESWQPSVRTLDAGADKQIVVFKDK